MKKKSITVFIVLLFPFLLFSQAKSSDLTLIDLAFAFAANNGVEDIKMLIRSNFDINMKHPKYLHSSVLHVAAEYNAEDVVKYIIESGGLVDIENDNQTTPLEIAVSKRNYKIASFLLSKGANINHYDLFHRTQLFNATINSDFDAVDFLLKNGADMYSVQHDSATALHVYLLNIGKNEGGRKISYDPRILMAYQRNGYDVKKKDSSGYNLIHTLAMQNLEDPWRIFERNITNYNEPIPEGYTPLFISILTQNFNSTKIILEHGVDVNSLDPNGATPVFYAVVNKNKELLALLKKYKLDLTVKDNFNKTVFEYADDEFKGLLKEI